MRNHDARKPVIWEKTRVTCNLGGCAWYAEIIPGVQLSENNATHAIWQHQLAEHTEGTLVGAVPGSGRPVSPLDKLDWWDGVLGLLADDLERAREWARITREADEANARIRKLNEDKNR